MWKRLHWYEPKRPYIRAHYPWTKMTLPIWGKMALVMRADTHQGAELSSTMGRIGFWWGWNGFYWGRYGPTWQNGPTKGQISSRGHRAESALWGWNRSFEFTAWALGFLAGISWSWVFMLGLIYIVSLFWITMYFVPRFTSTFLRLTEKRRSKKTVRKTMALMMYYFWA